MLPRKPICRTRRSPHDGAAHSGPRPDDRRRTRRGAHAVVVEGRGADRARLGADPGRHRAGFLVAQSADLSARGRHHRIAAARPGDPDARRRARQPRQWRQAEHGTEPVVLRLSGVRGNARLSPLPSAAPRPYPAGQRSGPRALGAVSDHRRELPAQVHSRHHRADRLPAAQGSAPERARRGRMAADAAPGAFLAEAWSADPGQRHSFRGPRTRRRVVGLSVAVAGAAIDLDDGDHADPQHRRTRGGAGQQRSAAQHADHEGGLFGAAVRRAVLRELSPRTSPAVLRALLQPAAGARDPGARAACRAHGGAAELCRRAEARDSEAAGSGSAGRDRQQCAAQARRHGHGRRSGGLRFLIDWLRRQWPV